MSATTLNILQSSISALHTLNLSLAIFGPTAPTWIRVMQMVLSAILAGFGATFQNAGNNTTPPAAVAALQACQSGVPMPEAVPVHPDDHAAYNAAIEAQKQVLQKQIAALDAQKK